MIPFSPAHRAVHYPTDRRFRVWILPSVLVLMAALVLVPLLLAWLQGALAGLPILLPSPASP